jgi:hypothetical protein
MRDRLKSNPAIENNEEFKRPCRAGRTTVGFEAPLSTCSGESALRRPSTVDLPAHQRDRLLVDRSRVPALDRGKIRKRVPDISRGSRASRGP